MGPYPEISLSEARSKREYARKRPANGINPAQQKSVITIINFIMTFY
ncbi:Arm DNA-binding domain-containing protein [Buttiauxella agrestis]